MNERILNAVGVVSAWVVFALLEAMFILLIVVCGCNFFYRMIISVMAGPIGVCASTTVCRMICKDCRFFHLTGIGVYIVATIVFLVCKFPVDVKCLIMIGLVAFLVAFVLTRKEVSILNWEHVEENVV